MEIHRSILWKRVNWYGFTEEEARTCPLGRPLWMFRIEQAEGQPLEQLLRDAAASARETRYTLADLAREWGVPRTTLQSWASRWGIKFPHGIKANKYCT